MERELHVSTPYEFSVSGTWQPLVWDQHIARVYRIAKAQAILRFSSVKSSLENSTNSLSCTGQYVCLLSGSAVSLCTTISLGTVPLPPLWGCVTCCVFLWHFLLKGFQQMVHFWWHREPKTYSDLKQMPTLFYTILIRRPWSDVDLG